MSQFLDELLAMARLLPMTDYRRKEQEVNWALSCVSDATLEERELLRGDLRESAGLCRVDRCEAKPEGHGRCAEHRTAEGG